MEYTSLKELMEKVTLAVNKSKVITDGRIEGKWFIMELEDSAMHDVGDQKKWQVYNLRIKTRMPI